MFSLTRNTYISSHYLSMKTLSKRFFSVHPDSTFHKLGIKNPNTIHYNLSKHELFEHETKNKEGTVFKTKYGDTFGVDTGKFTGRSPKDKWIVKNNESDYYYKTSAPIE